MTMVARWALPLMGTKGARYAKDYSRAREAEIINEAKKNTPVGRCYRGIARTIEDVCSAIDRKAKGCLPARCFAAAESSSCPTSPRTPRKNLYSQSTMGRFGGPKDFSSVR